MCASFHLETLGVIHEAIYYKILLPPLYIKSFICVYLIFFPSFSYVFACVRIDFILFTELKLYTFFSILIYEIGDEKKLTLIQIFWQ